MTPASIARHGIARHGIASKAAMAIAISLAPLAARAQERTIATVPSVAGDLRVSLPAQGEPIVITLEKNGTRIFGALVAPEDARRLAAALNEAADSSLARRAARPATGKPASEKTYFEFEVDTPARLVAGSLTPVYPPSLAARGISGEVDAFVVVDTAGRAVRRSLRIVHSPDALFSDALATAITAARFSPASKGGQKVPQLLALKYIFTNPQ